MELGASVVAEGVVRFKVWAPLRRKVSVLFPSRRAGEMLVLQKDRRGYFVGSEGDVPEKERYLYLLDGEQALPDPASRFQPDGVHGPSLVVDPNSFPWEDDGWTGVPLENFIIYEIHVGTFTKEGTFDAAVERLGYLGELGITAIELMPVAQFPGARNWGYDGVYPFAPQESYGGPDGLKRLINACHVRGVAVVLDVVYNHLGPEGSYLAKFAPYFTDRYKTPWGDAINFDGPYSDGVRRYFIDNALYWVSEFHVDALRIDAIQGIYDFSACHFLRELAEAVHSQGLALGRKVHVLAESDLNDVRAIDPHESGGYGLDAQWNDDFHHALHALVTGETAAYYGDFGKLGHMAKAFSEGFVYTGEYSPYRKRRHGSSSKGRPRSKFIVFSQNHDQVGNGAGRPSRTQSLEQLKLAAGVVLLSPFIPLLFMGEEYGEEAPFNYFVSFSDEALVEAVVQGRAAEIASFVRPEGAPDPGAEAAFLDSKIAPCGHRSPGQNRLYDFYRALVGMRKKFPVPAVHGDEHMEVQELEGRKALLVRRRSSGEGLFCLYNFAARREDVRLRLQEGQWKRVFDSSSEAWGGPGELSQASIASTGAEVEIALNPFSLVIYREHRP